MKIAVIVEFSTKHRNGDVEKAVRALGHETYNLGMKDVENEPVLNYMDTGFLSALLLNLKAVDFVVGGCGTGQGYMNAVLQFPGTACGLLMDPTEAYLFSQVNAGNCISLQLNKGYGGVGGDINVQYILEKLFNETYGGGYPPARAEIQRGLRKKLEQLSVDGHKPMEEIVRTMDQDLVKGVMDFPGVRQFIQAHAPDSELKKLVLAV